MYESIVRNGEINMSFWTKIGLVDLVTITRIQEEISCLRKENDRLLSEKTEVILRNIDEKSRDNNIFLDNASKAVLEELNNDYLKTHKIFNDVSKSTNDEIVSIHEALDLSLEKIKELKAENDKLRFMLEKIISDSEAFNDQILQKTEDAANDTAEKIRNQIIGINGSIKKIKATIDILSSEERTNNSYNSMRTEQILFELKEHESSSMKSNALKAEFDSLNDALTNLWKIMKVIFVESALKDLEKSI